MFSLTHDTVSMRIISLNNSNKSGESGIVRGLSEVIWILLMLLITIIVITPKR